jgi:hypothetical protein
MPQAIRAKLQPLQAQPVSPTSSQGIVVVGRLSVPKSRPFFICHLCPPCGCAVKKSRISSAEPPEPSGPRLEKSVCLAVYNRQQQAWVLPDPTLRVPQVPHAVPARNKRPLQLLNLQLFRVPCADTVGAAATTCAADATAYCKHPARVVGGLWDRCAPTNISASNCTLRAVSNVGCPIHAIPTISATMYLSIYLSIARSVYTMLAPRTRPTNCR